MRVRAIVLVAALCLALVPSGGSAGVPPLGWTHPELVHSVDDHDDHGFDLTTSKGRAYAVVSGNAGSGFAVYFATNATAAGRMRKQKVADLPTGSRVPQASIAVTPNGDVYIAYEQDPEFGPSTIVLASNAAGSWVTTPVPLTSATGAIESPALPDITALSDGSVAIVFQADHQAPCTGNGDIFLTTYANGAFDGPTNVTLANRGPLNRCVGNTFPAITASGTTLHLAYRWVSDAGGGVQLHYRSGTLTNGTDETVDSTSATTPGYNVLQFGVDITTDGAGAPHIAWTTDDGDNSTTSVRWAAKTGSMWTTEVVRSAAGGASVSRPSIAVKRSLPAVAYTLRGGGGGGPIGAQAFYAVPSEPDSWSSRDLNQGSTDNFEPQIAAAAGRFHSVLLEAGGPLGAHESSFVYQHEAPRPTVGFNLTGGKTFSGGEAVRMKGDIDPATVRETVVVHTQRLKGRRWVLVDKKRTRTNAQGEWSFRHDPLPTGRTYRARAEVRDTIDHLAGRNPWVRFEVSARRNH